MNGFAGGAVPKRRQPGPGDKALHREVLPGVNLSRCRMRDLRSRWTNMVRYRGWRASTRSYARPRPRRQGGLAGSTVHSRRRSGGHLRRLDNIHKWTNDLPIYE